ncbi:MAG: Holliday junction branch migration protein RuvA [Parcubacteria group bacterium]
MIAGLSGIVTEKLDKSVIVDVHGVRYELYVAATTLDHLPKIGQPLELWTRLVPSDNALTLFGFFSAAEQQLFDLLVTVTGVGPKLALNILGAGPVDEIIASIIHEKPEYFLKVARLGKKTASKIILDLKSKAESLFPNAATATAGRVLLNQVAGDDIALQALVELGYATSQAKAALAEVSAQDPSARVKAALQKLGSVTTVAR